LGRDPLTAPALDGGQVAWLHFEPKLIEQFFAGLPLPPQLGPRRGLDLPPRLELKRVEHADSAEPNLKVRVVAHDGGGGIGEARVLLGDRPEAKTYPLTADVEIPIELTLAKASCLYVSIYACNRAGLLCSRPVQVGYCPRSSHNPDDDALYQLRHQD